MKRILFGLFAAVAFVAAAAMAADATAPPLGLPPVPIPADNPQTPEKIALGKKLFEDKRFSATGQVACATCHDVKKAFTDSPLRTSEGIKKAGKPLTGTRNAPTVVNAAYFVTQFWDGRSPSLEDQSQHPFVNPVEMGLKDHQPILKIARTDPAYVKAFEQVFGKKGPAITMNEVMQAIAAFERTQVVGRLAVRPLLLRGRREGPDRPAEARLRPLRQQGPLRLLPRRSSRRRHSSPTTSSTTSASASTASRTTYPPSPASS